MLIAPHISSAIFMSLLGLAQSSAVMKRDKPNPPMVDDVDPCANFNWDNKDDTTHWFAATRMDHPADQPGEVHFATTFKVNTPHKSVYGIDTNYHYDVKAGTPIKEKYTFEIEVGRYSGPGLGQQFRFKLLNAENSILDTKWANPQRRCRFDVTYNPKTVTAVEVEARIWTRDN